ncbi:hypothetical protein C8R45DRAFT_1038642, partial [Mycena sanguinolenta]
PSLFSRARTASTPSKSKHKPPPPPPALSYPYPSSTPQPGTPIGEFGQQQAFFSHRPRSLSQGQQAQAAGEGGYGAVGFLPTTVPADLNVPWASTSSSSSAAISPSAGASTANLLFGSGGSASTSAGRASYGLLSPARDTVLGLPDVARLVAVLCAELERTSISTPFVFSSLALDVRRAGVARLIKAFLATCSHASNGRGGAGSGDKFADEARFAAAHELGMCLRWGLSRVVRVEAGREVRGLLSWAWYERWRVEEGPPILAPLFALCNKLVAHSGSSGHTPPSLASVFGPILFGLTGPTYVPPPMSPGGKKRSEKEMEAEEVLSPTIDDFGGFAGVYEEYLRGARAAEHILLASIREGIVGAEGRGLGAPTRLREWVGMYPASLEEGCVVLPFLLFLLFRRAFLACFSACLARFVLVGAERGGEARLSAFGVRGSGRFSWRGRVRDEEAEVEWEAGRCGVAVRPRARPKKRQDSQTDTEKRKRGVCTTFPLGGSRWIDCAGRDRDGGEDGMGMEAMKMCEMLLLGADR